MHVKLDARSLTNRKSTKVPTYKKIKKRSAIDCRYTKLDVRNQLTIRANMDSIERI